MNRILLASFIFCVFAFADPNPDFKFSAPLIGTMTKNQLYSLHLSGDIIRKSSDGFTDLRLFNKNGQEVPYVILRSVDPGEPDKTLAMEIINYSSDTGSVTIIARLPQEYQPADRIYLDIPDQDFNRLVIVETSKDMKKWELIKEDRIYDFTSQVNLRKTWFDLGENYFRFFRLTIKDETAKKDREELKIKVQGLDLMLGNTPEKRLKIGSLHAQAFGRKKEKIEFDEERFNSSALIDEQKNSNFFLEAGLPADRILFETGDEYYQRFVVLQVSQTGKENDFKFFTQDQIYKFPLLGKEESSNLIRPQSPKTAFYKIQIINKNNPPITVHGITLQWVKYLLVFSAPEDAGGINLCFGNRALKKPEYDLSVRVNQGNWYQQNLPALEIGAIEENRSFRDTTPTEQKASAEKALLTVVILMIVAFLGYWLLKLLKNTKPGTPV
ncbi:MAG: hypothetical protein PHW04_18790 [Candidatus Wallbacteria bacterium]|nr:hypothetical protein [Candidatus Wallbacteria bacterium]